MFTNGSLQYFEYTYSFTSLYLLKFALIIKITIRARMQGLPEKIRRQLVKSVFTHACVTRKFWIPKILIEIPV